MNIICSLTVLEFYHPLFPLVTHFTIVTSPTVPLPPLLQPPIHPHSACYQRLMGEKKGSEVFIDSIEPVFCMTKKKWNSRAGYYPPESCNLQSIFLELECKEKK